MPTENRKKVSSSLEDTKPLDGIHVAPYNSQNDPHFRSLVLTADVYAAIIRLMSPVSLVAIHVKFFQGRTHHHTIDGDSYRTTPVISRRDGRMG